MKAVVSLYNYKVVSIIISLIILSSSSLYSQSSYIVYGTDSGNPASAVYRMKTDGTESTAIWTAPNTSTYIEAVAFDASINKVYFYTDNASFDNGKVFRCNLDGSGLEIFLDVSFFGGVTRMAAANGYLYYAPANGTSLKRINSDGTNDITIYSGPTGISDVALDITNNYLFFVEKGNGTTINYYNLYRSDLNGGSRTSIYTTSNNYYLGGLSAGNGYVFFHRGDFHNQQRINNDGSNVQTVYTVSGGAVNNSAYDEFNKNLYFSYNQKIYKGSADGTGATLLKDVVQFIGFGANIDVAPNISVLPVELTSFTATISNKNVILNWKTATEVNNYGFEILRSAQKDIHSEKLGNLDTWKTLGFIEGHGNSNSPKDYSFVDEPAQSGSYSYRLKQIDFDGKFEYSDVVEVEVNNLPTEFNLSQNYPNPFNPTTSIEYSVPSKEYVNLKVYDILGNEVAELVNEQKSAGNYKVNYNAENLSSGLYIYKLQAGSFTQTRKMMLLK